jgi:hypothetical protein
MTHNIEHDLPLESGAYKIGENIFQSFLLAGERYLVSGLSREGTDERRFAEFYSTLGANNQDTLKGYFKKQVTLDLSQRTKILGDLVDLKISDPLTLNTTTHSLVSLPSVRPIISEVSPLLHNLQPISTSPPPRSSHNRLALRLEKIRVNEAQDDYWVWYPFVGKKVYNRTDEVSLGVVTIDESGWVKKTSLQSWQYQRRERKNL